MKKLCWLAVVGVAALAVMWPQQGSAISAWGRKYSLDCAACHEPANAPRLNVMGHQFRKAGYRFEADFEKAADYKEIGDYLHTRFRFRYLYTDRDPGNASSDRNEFKFNDVSFFYAGALTKNLTLFTEWEWAANNDITMSAFMSWTQGTWDRYWRLRLGQMKPIARVGWGGFDRPTGISTAWPITERITSSAIPFRLSEEQRGLEFMYSFSPATRVVASVWNGIDTAGSGRPNGVGDNNNEKDVLVYVEHMLDDRGSGITVLGYRGVYMNAGGTDLEFYRAGGSFNYVFPSKTEVQLGYLYGSDEDSPTGHTSGQAGWVELQQWLSHGAAVFVRGDAIQPNLDQNNWDTDWNKKLTLGGVYSVNDYLRLAAELFFERKISLVDDNWGIVTEAMVNF